MGEMPHTMPGIPQWLLAVSVALILLVSFILFEWLQRRKAGMPGEEGYWRSEEP